MTQDLEATYDEITYVSNNNEWQKHIYLTDELEKPADFLDCSFICRNVEKPNGCDLFLMEVKIIYFFLIQTSFDWHKNILICIGQRFVKYGIKTRS